MVIMKEMSKFDASHFQLSSLCRSARKKSLISRLLVTLRPSYCWNRPPRPFSRYKPCCSRSLRQCECYHAKPPPCQWWCHVCPRGLCANFPGGHLAIQARVTGWLDPQYLWSVWPRLCQIGADCTTKVFPYRRHRQWVLCLKLSKGEIQM